MTTVDALTIAAGLVLFAGVLAAGLWAVRHQSRQFPQGFDRTGWQSDRSRVGWLATKFTWLSGGRG